jgi:hypothetical protein
MNASSLFVDMRFELDPDDVFASTSEGNYAGRARDRAECEVFVRVRNADGVDVARRIGTAADDSRGVRDDERARRTRV